MTRKSIVIHGHSNIGRSGGAGRYGQQLCRQLNSQADKGELSSCDLFFSGFEEIHEGNLFATSRLTQFIDLLKHVAYRGLPPVFYEHLQRLYEKSRKKGALTEGTGCLPVPSWENSDSPVLLHELTNYNLIENAGRANLSSDLLLVVTFLDIQDYYYPSHFRPATLNSRQLLYSFFKDRADCFLAISEFTKQTMVERLKIAPEKIKVVHLAADDLQQLQPTFEDQRWVDSFGKFLIYPAKAWKHKNHEFLITALGRRRKEYEQAELQVLLTGGFSAHDIARLTALIKNNGLTNVVRILGFVSDVCLQALIRKAEYLIFPSLFEGFGIPLLEAMSLGCPVISSDAGALPEVGGTGAVYFDPESEDELVAIFDAILEQKGLDRQGMIEKGYSNCQRFSWQKTCNETVAVYSELLG